MSNTQPRPQTDLQGSAPIPLRPSTPVERPASLPLPLTSFVGREHEIELIATLTRRPSVRLVTLTGPGGVGKTRLAIRTAEDIAGDFPDGVWFVPLAAVPTAELVAASVAQALAIELSGYDVIDSQITRYIGYGRALLILDNLEHLLDCDSFIVGLLESCPRLTVLATSRTVLRLSAEHVFRVPPLEISDDNLSAEIGISESMRLFADRAAAADSAFTMSSDNIVAIAGICRRLDGLPLAIELAAARIAMSTPAQLLARFEPLLPLLTDGPRDAPARQQAMNNAISWSYGLLEPRFQAFFRRLSVFVDGFCMNAAAAIAGEPAAGQEGRENVSSGGPPSLALVLEGIRSLLDHSLLQRVNVPSGEERFGMLETIREFGLQQLVGCGEEMPIRDAHAAYFVEFAAHGGAGLRGNSEEQAPLWHRLNTEIGNFRAAIAWLRDRGRTGDALRLAGGLDWFWSETSYQEEGRRVLQDLLKHADHAIEPGIHAQALTTAAMLANLREDLRSARELSEEAIPLWRLARRADAEAETLLILGTAALSEDRIADAANLAGEAEKLAVRSGALWAEAAALHLLGRCALTTGDHTRALVALRRAVKHYRDADDPFRELAARSDEGLALLLAGDQASARHVFSEVLETDMVINEDLGSVPQALFGIAALIAGVTPSLAARLVGAANAHSAHLGRLLPPQMAAAYESLMATGRTRLGEEAWQAAWTAGQTQGIKEAAIEGRAALERLAGELKPAPPAGGAAASLGLTRRELEVLLLISDGLSDREIADRLFIARRTASKHVEAILAKLCVSSRGAAAAEARRLGLC